MRITREQFERLIEVLQLKETKDENGNYYYMTTWGKKTWEGLRETIEAILSS